MVLKEVESGLEAPFPLTVKDNGEGSVQIVSAWDVVQFKNLAGFANPVLVQSQKDLPVQLLLATKPLQASIIVASFGSAEGLNTPVFSLEVQPDANAPAPSYEKPLRYGKRPEIRHIFGSDPRSPPKVISLFFALAVLATVPALFVAVSTYLLVFLSCVLCLTVSPQWLLLGANLSHLSKAVAQAPLSHAAFIGSIIGMEFVFFLYYSTWNLFQVLPVLGLVGAVAVISGPKALGEVQSRRLAGER